MHRWLADNCWDLRLKVHKNYFTASRNPTEVTNVSVTAIPVHNAYFGEGDSELKILLDDVTCYGNETSLENCQSIIRRNSDINCSHSEDAGVYCNGEYHLCLVCLIQLLMCTVHNNSLSVFSQD